MEGEVVVTTEVQEAYASDSPAQVVYRDAAGGHPEDCGDSAKGVRLGVICEPCQEDFVVRFDEAREECDEPVTYVAWLAPISAEEAEAAGCGPTDGDRPEVEAPLEDDAPRAEAVAFEKDEERGCHECGHEPERVRLVLAVAP